MEALKQIPGLILGLLLLAGLMPVTAGAHSNFTSSNYIGVDDVQDSGGDRASSTSYNILSAICQTGIDAIASGSYKNFAGFLHPLLSQTPTPTCSPTFTPTPTITITINSPTVTPTITATQTFTHTLTITITPTITYTPTITQTATMTETFTHSPTITDTPTITQTATITETFTHSPTVTDTPTITQTATITETFTHSPTITDTPTITPTATITKTITPTSTITLTATITNTFTDTPTITITSTSIAWTGSGSLFYPNPAKIGVPAHFQIEVDAAAEVVVMVYNAAGERAAEVKAGCQPGIAQLSLDTASLSAGIYYYRISIDGQNQEVKKLVLLK